MITLGIDIGGSATKGALVDTETGKMVSERIRYETETLVKPREVAALVEKIRKKLGYHGIIGAGYPGVVKNGVAMTAANLHKNWIGTDVAALIFNQTGQVTTVLNDADAAGLAEMRFGVEEARQYKTVLFLTVGTGIGSALFVDGHLIPNTELGHLKIRRKDAEHRLIQYIGKTKAMELLMTADIIGADDARQLGLVNYLVPSGSEIDKAKELIEKIATKAPFAISKVIECVNAYYETGVDGFWKEVDAFGECSGTEDFREGAAAFVEKRKATFSGK